MGSDRLHSRTGWLGALRRFHAAEWDTVSQVYRLEGELTMSIRTRIACVSFVAGLLTILPPKVGSATAQTACAPADSVVTAWVQGTLDGAVSGEARLHFGSSHLRGEEVSELGSQPADGTICNSVLAVLSEDEWNKLAAWLPDSGPRYARMHNYTPHGLVRFDAARHPGELFSKCNAWQRGEPEFSGRLTNDQRCPLGGCPDCESGHTSG